MKEGQTCNVPLCHGKVMRHPDDVNSLVCFNCRKEWRDPTIPNLERQPGWIAGKGNASVRNRG